MPTETGELQPAKEIDGADDHGGQSSNALSKTERLVADVVAAGGALELSDETARGGVDYRQRAYAAQRHGKVPEGKHLTVVRANGSFTVSLVDGATGNELGADEVPVPARVTRYHAVARQFRDRTGIHEVSRKALPRVLRIVHALALEIEHRGHHMECVAPPTNSYGRTDWKPRQDGQLVVTINGHSHKVRIWEKGAGLRGPWEQQKKSWEEDRLSPRFGLYASRPRAYDAHATGELNASILGYSSRQDSWGDRKRWRLEDRLAQLVRELEVQAVEAEERRLAREREEAERQRLWEAAMADAKRQFLAAHRRDVLRERARAWQEADVIRAYCDAVESRHGKATVAADRGAGDWLAYAREHAERLQALPTMPPEPEPTSEALKPYLGGLSPYGPRG